MEQPLIRFQVTNKLPSHLKLVKNIVEIMEALEE